MNRLAALLPVIFLIAMLGTVYAQSLAELANKEKERRQEIKDASKVITNAEAAKYRSSSAATTSVPAEIDLEADAEEGEIEEGMETESSSEAAQLDEPVDFQGRPESFWRKTMAEARKRVKDLENEANVLVLKQNDLQNQFYREDDGFKREWIGREIQKTFFEQDRNKENLAKAKDALQDLEKEARKSGALPGWISAKNP